MSRTQPLKEIAEIRPGYQFRGRVEPDAEGSHRVLQIRDLQAGGPIDMESLVRVTPDRDPKGSLVKEGDVLFLSRGQRLTATALPPLLADTLASGYFFIMTLRGNDVLPEFLAWYLNQPVFQQALRPYVRGSHMPLVSLSDFEGLPVQLPSLEIQRSIVALAGLHRRETELMNTIRNRRETLIQAVCLGALRHRQPKRG